MLYLRNDKESRINIGYQNIILYNELFSIDFEKTRTTSGINIEKNCLYLRSKLSLLGSKIICMQGNIGGYKFGTELKAIDSLSDLVKVSYFERHNGSKQEEELNEDFFSHQKQKIGWVKAIGKNGFPIIWFSVSGY